jgi:hypothetical protein
MTLRDRLAREIVLTGPMTVADMSKIRGQSGHEVFSERKNLSFFQNKVRLCSP